MFGGCYEFELTQYCPLNDFITNKVFLVVAFKPSSVEQQKILSS
jgi:hypothetical protein